jgi:initiation factor 1A
MVKNTFGGNKSKGFARKDMNQKSNKTRIAVHEGELYAIATKMLGNNMLHCHGIDNKVRLCHIRGKFTGRGKRGNVIEAGTWLLIGTREWSESITDKIEHCDLLEVYKDNDVIRLKDTVSVNWSILTNNDVKNISAIDKDSKSLDFDFKTVHDEERERLVKEMNSSSVNKISLDINETDEEIVSFDDL